MPRALTPRRGGGPFAAMSPSAFRRIAACAAATLALAMPGAPAVAQHAPQIPYRGYPADETVSLAGAAVRAPADVARDAIYEREIARVRATQKHYEPAPAIWRIADVDTVIYLFGTIHSLPIGFRWRNAGLEAVIARADSLLLESVDDGTEDSADFLSGVTSGGAPLPPLRDRVSGPYRKRLAEFQRILPPAAVAQLDRMPSWMAALGISSIRNMLGGDVSGQGADDWLERYFRSTGKPVEAIEDSDSVLASINQVSERAQRLMLESALVAPLSSRSALDGPAHAWAQGEVGADSPLIIVPEQLDPSAALADPMLARRNAAWVDDLLRRMERRAGVILFAAGAGHFVGPGSVLELLAARGVAVERVQ